MREKSIFNKTYLGEGGGRDTHTEIIWERENMRETERVYERQRKFLRISDDSLVKFVYLAGTIALELKSHVLDHPISWNMKMNMNME